MALPLANTLLGIHSYAKILGINPAHFAGGAGSAVFPVMNNACEDVWARYSWQASDRVSHEELALEIHNAERDIAAVLGYFPAPTWIEEEVQPYPRHHRRDTYNIGMSNVRGQLKSLKLRWGKFIQGGIRSATQDEFTTPTPIVNYLDVNGDGFIDTARLTSVTTVTNVFDIKVYFAGLNGARAWEVRPIRSKSITLGVVTIELDPWLLIDPDRLAALPTTGGFTAVNLDSTPPVAPDDYVATVDLYYERNDSTEPGAILYWEQEPILSCSVCSGLGCAACSFSSQDGCIHVRDTDRGFVAVTPGVYDDDVGAWQRADPTVCRDPDQIKLYYYGGEQSDEWLSGWSYDPLSHHMAQAIAWMATARLERPFCACSNVTTLGLHLKEDLSLTTDQGRFVSDTILTNPFGTRRGEVKAWQRISMLIDSAVTGVAI